MEIVKTIAFLFWGFLPIIIGWYLLQADKRERYESLIRILQMRSVTLINWADCELAEENDDDKIMILTSSLIAELQGLGFSYKETKWDFVERYIVSSYYYRDSYLDATRGLSQGLPEIETYDIDHI